ncbi:unnamed protein product [Brassica oleracea var. botrytis]|uniref:Uncharacterized protein n=2 Tax=Brassica TaxID=3705 RepID=A0A8X7RS06_BRACI|nr:hypothetical protein Bca52824_050283 [Brassica carinata]VDD04047.1 unnamed protein product [Brassica oleracea]
MVMEEKLVIKELEQGRELAKRLMSNLKDISSVESSKTLISEILSIYQNDISMLSVTEEDKNILKRSREIDDKDTKNIFKKRFFILGIKRFFKSLEMKKSPCYTFMRWKGR